MLIRIQGANADSDPGPGQTLVTNSWIFTWKIYLKLAIGQKIYPRWYQRPFGREKARLSCFGRFHNRQYRIRKVPGNMYPTRTLLKFWLLLCFELCYVQVSNPALDPVKSRSRIEHLDRTVFRTGFRIRIDLMRIRIQHFISMGIRIKHFTLMRIWI